ncbi:hypothetical protein [Trinickia fusca]|uniref:Uncharacterized protein n=1 Tax=Trinickia fusca TaxID=2419777 RepID=A0A494X8E3_9BURK|nr:hypothetical protein [Trinickia fusca]RKP46828.1 hypothetical protein D7S89_15810 [Trinickia fusca]
MNEAMLVARLAELKANYEAGQMQLQRLDAQQRELQHTLLRLSGAIQLLEEMREELREVPSATAREGVRA